MCETSHTFNQSFPLQGWDNWMKLWVTFISQGKSISSNGQYKGALSWEGIFKQKGVSFSESRADFLETRAKDI